jgi:hypothetical protein
LIPAGNYSIRGKARLIAAGTSGIAELVRVVLIPETIGSFERHIQIAWSRVEGETVVEQKVQVTASRAKPATGRSWVIGLTSFLFILLQSACTAVMALSGLRLLIGVGSLAFAASGIKLLASIHGNAIRVPMELLAVGGSAVNLYVIWRIRSLRARPSSQWRVAPIPPAKSRAESLQIAIAILTLLLVAAEWTIHIILHGSI